MATQVGIARRKKIRPTDGNLKRSEPQKKLQESKKQIIINETKADPGIKVYHAEKKSHSGTTKDNETESWKQNVRPRKVRAAVIFGILSALHSALATYFNDKQAGQRYALLACVSLAMAFYTSYVKTARSFQRVLWIILLMFEIGRIFSIAFTVSWSCAANPIGSTCTQLGQNKYPMRWAMDAVAVLTLANSLPSSIFIMLACVEMLLVVIALREVKPANLAEQDVVTEVFLGLLLVILSTYSQLRSNEIMRNTIYSRERTDRIVHHRIKNILADTYSTLLLYPKGLANLQDLQRSAKSVQRASRSIQNSLNFSQLLNPEFHGSSEPDRNTREVKLRSWIREHGPAHPFEIFAKGFEFPATFIIYETLATELFLDLALDNAALHGGGDTRVDCHFEGEELHIDVNNNIDDTPAKVMSHREFSTCLGTDDLLLVCSKRKIPFKSGAGDDGRWHSSIRVSAVRLNIEKEIASASIPSPSLVPHNLRVAVVDDVRMIVKLCKVQLQRELHACVEDYHVDTLEAYETFVNVTIPEKKCGWDIVILDQHLGLKCGALKKGTELMDLLRDTEACLIMHSGNNNTKDCALYASHGCHGVVGKGVQFVEEVAQIYLDFVSQRYE